MYSGNIGITHDLSFISRLAVEFSNDDRLRFIIMGEAGYKKVKGKIAVPNVLFFDYKSDDEFPLYLALEDIGIVTLSKGTENSSVPSKTIYFDPLNPESVIAAIFDLRGRLLSGWFSDWTNALRKLPKSWDEVAEHFMRLLG